MNILSISDSSSLTCEQCLNDKLITWNGTYFDAWNQFIDSKIDKPTKLYDQPSCQCTESSTTIVIMTTKVPIGNRTILNSEIWFNCSKTRCNGQEMTDRVENTIN